MRSAAPAWMRVCGPKPMTPLASRYVPHAHTAPISVSAHVWLSPAAGKEHSTLGGKIHQMAANLAAVSAKAHRCCQLTLRIQAVACRCTKLLSNTPHARTHPQIAAPPCQPPRAWPPLQGYRHRPACRLPGPTSPIAPPLQQVAWWRGMEIRCKFSLPLGRLHGCSAVSAAAQRKRTCLAAQRALIVHPPREDPAILQQRHGVHAAAGDLQHLRHRQHPYVRVTAVAPPHC